VPSSSASAAAWWVAFAWFSHLRGVAQYSRGALLDASADLESANAAYADAGAEPLPDTRAILALCRLERDDLAGASDVLGLDRQPAPPSSCSYVYAREPLRAGLDLAACCGALVLARRARDELVA
jgi:hypothetical protein